jgi:hypothetical protein
MSFMADHDSEEADGAGQCICPRAVSKPHLHHRHCPCYAVQHDVTTIPKYKERVVRSGRTARIPDNME